MRRLCIWILMWLVMGPLARAQPTPFREKAVGVYAVAFQYGNYAACARILEVLSGLSPDQTVEVHRLLNSLARGNYSQAIPAAQELLGRPSLQASREEQILVLYVLIEGGRRAGYPQLVDQYLPQALALADEPEDRFVFHSLAAERELEKNPDLPLAKLIERHDECWKMLQGFVPTHATSGGGVASRAARFWIGEWFRRMRGGDKSVIPILEKDVARLLELASSGIQAVKGFNPQYEIGGWEATLDLLADLRGGGRLKIARDNLTKLDRQLEVTRPQLRTVQNQLDAWTEGQDLLRCSILEGDVSRVEARVHQEWVRLLLAESGNHPNPDQLKEIERRLQLAREAQRLASAGQGFLGLEEVDWDALALVFSARPTGWQDAASALVTGSLERSRKVGFRPGEILALTYQGELLLERGERPSAQQSLQEAVQMVEKFIEETGGSAAAGARLRLRFKRAYDLLTEVQLSQGRAEDAFDTQARRQQMELLVQSKGSPALEQAVTLKGRGAALEQELVRSRSAGQDTRPAEKLLARTRSEFYTELTRIRTSNPKYESMLAIRPVNFAQLQRQIPADTCLIQYFPAESSLYIFVATHRELKIRKVELGEGELTRLVGRFRQLTANPAVLERQTELRATLLSLHAALIEPLEADIRDRQVLAFIPTGVLNYLPMGALARSDARGRLEYLIERKQVAVVLKSSDLDALARPPVRPAGAVLGLGDPDGSLPGAALEVRDVTRLFPGSFPFVGKQATQQRLAGPRKGAVAYLHLATHGVLDNFDPNASYLVMAGSPSRLSVPQIYDLRLEGVRLVTLSACQTAIGREQGTQGSELTTLASAFSVAGSNSVVASLWSVNDESTRKLMAEFYAGLKRGHSLARALQQAELKLLRDPRFAHPYYWAPFELIGDWR